MTVIQEKMAILPSPTFDDPQEKSLYELLEQEVSLDISSIEDTLGMDIATIAFRLSMMEVRGIISMNIDGSYGVR